MTQAEAKALCVTKWEYIVDNEGSVGNLYDTHPELRIYVNGCAYCDLYRSSSKGKYKSCYGCPVKVNSNRYKTSTVGCQQTTHPWMVWNRSKTTANAQAVLDLINAT